MQKSKTWPHYPIMIILNSVLIYVVLQTGFMIKFGLKIQVNYKLMRYRGIISKHAANSTKQQ